MRHANQTIILYILINLHYMQTLFRSKSVYYETEYKSINSCQKHRLKKGNPY